MALGVTDYSVFSRIYRKILAMPPDGYNSLTDAVETASAVAVERDETELAQILADQLAS